MCAGLALAAVAFAKMTANTGGKLIEGQDYPKQWSNMMLGMMVVFISFYATGSGNITWQCAELFPLELRGMGSAILAGGVWAANIVISATFLTIMDHVGAAGAFGIYAGICAVSMDNKMMLEPLLAPAHHVRIDTGWIHLHLLLLPRSQWTFARGGSRVLQARFRDPQVEGDQEGAQGGLQAARRGSQHPAPVKWDLD